MRCICDKCIAIKNIKPMHTIRIYNDNLNLAVDGSMEQACNTDKTCFISGYDSLSNWNTLVQSDGWKLFIMQLKKASTYKKLKEMKNKTFLIALLLIGSLFNSCDSDHLEHQDKFEISQKTWLDFKESSNDSYKYTVTSSSWIGFSWETTITVENGIVIQRNFEYTSTEGISTDIQEDEFQWTETDSEIGTHENGAEPITLNEIYNKAQNDWLMERNNTTTYLETENNGMISICGYVDNQCADDCFIGVSIKKIESL